MSKLRSAKFDHMRNRMYTHNKNKLEKVRTVLAEICSCSLRNIMFVDQYDRCNSTLSAEHRKNIRDFVRKHGRKMGHYYNYELFEMQTFHATGNQVFLQREFVNLIDLSTPFDSLYAIDKTKI